MIGNKLHGCYHIIKDFKKGAFGKTYLAEYHPLDEIPDEYTLVEGMVKTKSSLEDGTKCIIKVLKSSSNHPYILDGAKSRFNTEVKKLEKLGHHPQIPSVLDAFIEENEQLCLVEEFIEGHDLTQEFSEGKPWPEAQVIALLYNVLEVLEVIHDQGLIHRNIKPSNLIRRLSDHQIVPIDFGSFKEIETLVLSFGGKVTTSMIGTPGYMAVEQLGGQIYPNSDIYALGITAIQALSGIHPTKLERDIKTGQVIWQHLVQCSEEFIAIVDKMVCPDWQDRYQSATEILAELQGFHEIGETIENRYKIINFLGESAFGKTYLTTDRDRGNAPCVLKKIQPQKIDPFPFWEVRILFDTEAQNLQRIGTHDKIPRLLDDFPGETEFYLVHEFIQGKSLTEEIALGKFTESETIALLQDVLPTLMFVHQQNVIHSNIHPSNLIKRYSDGELVLLDFGSVKQISTMALDEQGQLTTTGTVGTLGYMPKEQQAGNPRPNSDIYALGMIAIQALTGVHPSQLETDHDSGEISWRHLTEVSDRLADILDKMTHVYFRERYQSASEVLNDLATLPEVLSLSAKPTTSIPDQPLDSDVEKNQKPSSTESQSGRDRTPVSASVEPATTVTRSKPSWQVWLRVFWVSSAILILGGSIGGAIWFKKYEENRSMIRAADAVIEAASERLDMREAIEAEKICDRAIAINPNYSYAWKCRGDALFLLQRYPAALVAYKKASELEPTNPKFLNNQGEVLSQLNQYHEAMAVHDQALKLDPENANARKGRGVSLIGLKQYEAALKELREAVSLNPDDPTLWEYQGLVHAMSDNSQDSRFAYEEAVAVYDQKLQTDPNDLISWIERGRILSKLRRYDDAVASYDRALKINPSFYLAWNAKATTFYEMQKFDKALEAYDKTVELNPNFYTGWHNRGSLLSAGLKRYADAVKSYDKALKINPSFYHAWRDRGIALAENQQYEAAIESFDEALKIEPNDYPSWVSRGMALTELARDEEALVSFDKAIEIYPNDAFAWTQRGFSLEYLNRDEEALKSYNKAIEIQPNFSPAIKARSELR